MNVRRLMILPFLLLFALSYQAQANPLAANVLGASNNIPLLPASGPLFRASV